MSNIFNFNRFLKYFKYDMKHQKKNIGVMVLSFILLPVAVYLCDMIVKGAFEENFFDLFKGMVQGPDLRFRVILFMLSSGIFVLVYPSKAYGEITDKEKGTAWLMIPASRLEKFISMILITLIIVPAVYFCGSLICDWLVCMFDKSCGTPIIADSINMSRNVIGLEDGNFNALRFLVSSSLEAASIYLLGALIFKKWKIVNTILSQMVIGIILILILEGCFNWFADIWNAIFSFDDKETFRNLMFNVKMIIFAIIVIGCNTWSWFRIKRIQH